MTNAVTAMVLTLNEEANIGRTLDSVAWADRILVIDSGSSDATLSIVAQYPQARVLHRSFTTAAEQCNFGLQHVETPWVLSMDADYVFPPEAAAQVASCVEAQRFVAFAVPFDYAVYGKVVRGSILPPRTVLYRREQAHYVDEGHTQRVNIVGPVGSLPLRIIHDDRKPLGRWLASQTRYAAMEASVLAAAAWSSLSWPDRIRKLVVPAPIAVFLLVYVARGGFLSGWHGFYYALQRGYAELLLSLALLDAQLRRQLENR